MIIQQKLTLPAGITLLNALSGFSAILLAINEMYVLSAIAIIFAGIFDFFDGRVARWLKRTSSFGVELDSLADTVSFVIAPTILIYQSFLSRLGHFGLFVCGLAVVCGIVRLAKFNLKVIPDFFEGMPTPTYGILISMLIIAGTNLETKLHAGLIGLVSLLMISRIKYPNFKKGVRGIIGFVAISIVLGIGALCGDLTASFIKRRIGLKSGAKAPALLDQLNLLVGAFVFSLLLIPAQWKFFVVLLILTPPLHKGSNVLAYKLGLKKQAW